MFLRGDRHGDCSRPSKPRCCGTEDSFMTSKSKAGGSLGPGTGIGNAAGSSGSAAATREPTQAATGQRRSNERGASTRSKKNPGKRPRQGGSSA
jgi:hypothetical protein